MPRMEGAHQYHDPIAERRVHAAGSEGPCQCQADGRQEPQVEGLGQEVEPQVEGGAGQLAETDGEAHQEENER